MRQTQELVALQRRVERWRRVVRGPGLAHPRDELKEIARHYRRRERPGHTLQSTALINEAYLRLVDAEVEWKDRVHFFAVASRIMRRVLVDYARAHKREKRGGSKTLLSLDQLPEAASASASTPPPTVDLVDLDGALRKLSTSA